MPKVDNHVYVNDCTSKKVQCISFLAFSMVVLIHSQALDLINTKFSFNKEVQSFLFHDLTAWAVPWFFALSGFFFSRKIICSEKLCVQFWKKLYIGKIRALLIPYFIWTILVSSLLLPLVVGSNYISGRYLLENTPFQHGVGVENIAVDFLGLLSWKGPKLAGHLWFLHTLIIIFLISPLFGWLFRRKRIFKITALCILVFCQFLELPLAFALLWFLFGGVVMPYVFEKSSAVGGFIWFRVALFGLCWVSFSFLSSSFCAHLFDARCFKIISIVFGMLFFINLSEVIKYKSYFKHTFFYYCSHIMFTSWATYVLLFFFKDSAVVGWIISICAFAFGVLGPVFTYRIVSAKIPRLIRIITGGR